MPPDAPADPLDRATRALAALESHLPYEALPSYVVALHKARAKVVLDAYPNILEVTVAELSAKLQKANATNSRLAQKNHGLLVEVERLRSADAAHTILRSKLQGTLTTTHDCTNRTDCALREIVWHLRAVL